MKDFFRNFGSALAILGAMAIGLGYANRVPKILAWIYEWGEDTAWMIKIGLVVVGVIFFGLSLVMNDNSEHQAENSDTENTSDTDNSSDSDNN